MDFYNTPDSVRCEKCAANPAEIIWEYDFDYDGNDRVHEYGKYTCICGDSSTFSTNAPYEEEHDELF